jgi:phosphopentomutase
MRYRGWVKLTVIVLDSVGVGELPDAAQFGRSDAHPDGDAGSHTLNHTMQRGNAKLPNLFSLGLGHIETVKANGFPNPTGAFGRMREVSLGKDTSTGHWEFMGIQLANPFQTFYDGFPPEVMDRFSAAIGTGWLCNTAYSGTDVIRDFGAEHLRTGFPIVYTSADSVFQIAAHVDKVPLETLYEWCEAARGILQGEFAVARVIARPFKGAFPFERMGEARKDFSLEPPLNALDALLGAGLDVIGLGKIPDIYANRGFTQSIHTDNNADGIQKTLEVMRSTFRGLAFCNLVDFDAKYGHRRDVNGYARALEEFDTALPELMAEVSKDDLLILISDHGNDPTWFGTDHTREHGLLLAYRPGLNGVDLGTRSTFSDIAATVCDALGVPWNGHGSSFWAALAGEG